MGKFFSFVGPIVGLAFVGLSGVATCHRGRSGPRNLIGPGRGDIHNCAGGLYQGLIAEDPEFHVFRWRARRKLI